MIEVVLGVGMFAAIVLALVGIILVAKIEARTFGDITIEINGEPDEGPQGGPAGGKLLNTRRPENLPILGLWRRWNLRPVPCRCQ